MNSSEASSSMSQSYEVFLSFRGPDTRYSFTDFLYMWLEASGYKIFRDKEGIERGQTIQPSIQAAIGQSTISIVVLSEDYGSSEWCLDELVMIMNRREQEEHHVLPIFYHVNPSDVRTQSGSFARSFVKHEETYKDEMGRVDGWRAALGKVGRLNGEHVKERSYEATTVIQSITQDVGRLIKKKVITAGLERRNYAFPVPELVGESFKEPRENIWSLLMNDKVNRIGVCGTGGAGKTTLMKHIHNQLLEAPRRFYHVYWITASQDCNEEKLQELIAYAISLELTNREDGMSRAAKLCYELDRKEDFVLIIDDIWEHFDLLQIGLSPIHNRYKLIFTTRSPEVCRKMNCQKNIINVEPLSFEEAWVLFKRELGVNNINSKVKPHAKEIVRQCAGLPLAIQMIARRMKGVEHEYEWRNAEYEINDPKVGKSPLDPVFNKLIFSYKRLNNSFLQQCLLYCALFPQGSWIRKEELIEYMIVEGIIGRRNFKRDEVDKGQTMLNELVNLCLLENGGGNEYVKMNDLVRKMVINIFGEKVMVEAGKQLKECPDTAEWKQSLVRVSLMRNNISRIDPNHSPICPNLSTLLLCQNGELESISDSFFMGFNGLKGTWIEILPESISNLVRRCAWLLGDCFHIISNLFFERSNGLRVLDLSGTIIKGLPDSICNLVSLSALLLRDCYKLKSVPSLAKLKALVTLDLRGCKISEVPSGLASLHQLRFLNLSNCRILKKFPAGILPNLSLLQVLRIDKKLTLKGQEVGRLKKLEDLVCGFLNLMELNNCLRSEIGARLPDVFEIFVNNPTVAVRAKSRLNKYVNLWRCDLSRRRDFQALPKGIEELEFNGCQLGARSLSDISVLSNASELKSIGISSCDGVECLASASALSANIFSRLEFLQLSDTNSLQKLVSNENENEDGGPQASLSTGTFAHLKSIEIKSCHNMKNLFPPGLLRNLQNLEEIEVQDCDGLKEIVATEENSTNDSSGSVALPKLRKLWLVSLPRLESISSVELRCVSLRNFQRPGCPMLTKKRISFS